ncbi:hypothetical protein VP01_4144g2 [Puccinia sorghi]|uniref:Uncharacterized protein n=1 Tax=Puccinia sorghi TaxID=27349 RepID=A0A0L6UT00_9BASI|nr:hypothetical protein VP01_4144g2 [Puccinia sorghi]
MSKTIEADPMDKLNSFLYKTAIKSIPLLTQENYSMWCSGVINLLDLLKIKDVVLTAERQLTSSEELILQTVLAAEIDATVHSNVINHTNKEDAYEDSDVDGFITRTQATIEKMHEVGINIDKDVVMR